MTWNYFLDNIKRLFFRNKMLFIWTAIILFIAFAIGIFCAIKTDTNIDINLVQDFCLKRYLTNDYNFFEFVFVKIIVFFAIFLLITLLSFFKFGNIFSFLLGFYLGFLTGIDCAILVVIFGVLKGLLLSLFVVALFEMSLILLLILFSTQMLARNKGMRCFGKSILGENLLKLFFFNFLICIVFILLQGVLLATICKIFVF